MKVMTYNIRCIKDEPDEHNNWLHRKKAVVDIIKKHDPDFLCLQEDSPVQLDYITKRIKLHHHHNYHSPRGRLGEALSIYCIKKIQEKGHFWLTKTPMKKSRLIGQSVYFRHVTYVIVDGIYIFNTHFDHLDSDIIGKQGKILATIIKKMKPEKYVICGDFNCEINGQAIQVLKNEFDLISKNLSKKGRKCWSEACPASKCIDFIFSNIPGKAIMDRSTYLGRDHVKRTPSDHYPVIAQFNKIY